MKQKKTIELAYISTKYRYVCCTLLVFALYADLYLIQYKNKRFDRIEMLEYYSFPGYGAGGGSL